MSRGEETSLLRPGLLDGVSLLLATAGAPPSALAGAIAEGCERLGADVAVCALPEPSDDIEQGEAAVASALGAATEHVDVLVLDAPALFARASGNDALMGCLQAAWDAARATANRAFIPDGRGGRIVLVAPRPDAGEHADAARAGLENLARTLSIEWSRHGVTAVTIAPGEATGEQAVGALVAFLASPAGAYFSGCQLDLRGP